MTDTNTGNSSSIVLMVKVTNLAAADLIVEGLTDWTVGQLKERISALLPSRPAVSQQKLVYYGKLLEDRQTLVDALKQNTFGGSHTVHLVVTGGMSNPNVAASPQPVDSAPQASASGTAPWTGSAHAFSTMYSLPNTSFGHLPVFTPTTPGGFWTAEAGRHMAAQQYLWMQLYVQQMQHWHAQLQRQTELAGGSIPEPAAAAGGEATGTNAPTHVPAPQQGAAAAVAARDPDVVRMNAQGGEDDADGGENQDVIDWLYTGIRVLVLFSLLYFYSSLSRLMLVITVGAGLWMFRGGLLRQNAAARRPFAAAREVRAPVAGAEQQQQPNQPPAPDQSEPDNRNPESPRNQTVNPTVAAGRGILAVAASVVGNFFATLIPHHPPAGNLN